MSLYPESVARCQHIKVNGTQCGSPALRSEKYCYFHMQWQQKSMEIHLNIQPAQGTVTLPVLEDANSVQMGLVEVMRLMVTRQIDHRTAALMLYGLQTASSNLKHTSFEPVQPTHVVIDRECVERRPIGATAWSKVKGREYDELTEKIEDAEPGESELSESTKAFMLDQLGLPPDTLERFGLGGESNGDEELVKN